jgi:hypothetical protein
MTESSAQDRSGQDRISAPLALHEVDAITNFTRDASQSANDQDQSLKVGLWQVFCELLMAPGEWPFGHCSPVVRPALLCSQPG